MLMLKCKTYDQIFLKVYVDEENNDNESRSSNIENYRIFFQEKFTQLHYRFYNDFL